jgi:uncharacterized membrane protein
MIMKPTTERLVDDYLKQLDSELADLPRLRRKEIVEEISEHIADAWAASPSQGEAEIRTLLDRLGDPAEIASERRSGSGCSPGSPAHSRSRRSSSSSLGESSSR